jgi:transmembrane sensor
MNNEPTYYTDLITRYFSGEATEEEIQVLSAWLSNNEENLQLFEEYRKSWLAVEQSGINDKIDISTEWDIFREKVERNKKLSDTDKKIIPLEAVYDKRKGRLYRIGRIAAILILIAISAGTSYFILNNKKEIRLVASLENKEVKLPDGTHVSLTPGATLTYPETFDKNERKVKLQGEAYFEVKHDPQQPFIIIADNIVHVEVLGTSFYVNTDGVDNKIEVILTSGKVAVYYTNTPDNKTIMKPGDKVELSKTRLRIEKSVNDEPNYMSWKTGKLEFTDTRLDNVVRLLNKVYHADVRLMNKDLGNCRLTATFNNQSIESVLNVVKETLSLTVKKNGKIIEISGNGCK